MNELNPHELNPNPYAPGVVQKKEILSEVEQRRQKYLNHETSVKSIGVVCVVGGLFSIVSGADLVAGGDMIAIALILLGIAQFVVAIGIRKLHAWSKIPATFCRFAPCSPFQWGR